MKSIVDEINHRLDLAGKRLSVYILPEVVAKNFPNKFFQIPFNVYLFI